MTYRRIHVRVPIVAEAVLNSKSGICIKAQTIDISLGGIGVKGELDPAIRMEYEVEICTSSGETIELTAELVRVEDACAGFRLTGAEKQSLQIITKLVEEYQHTEDFVKQLYEYELLQQKYIDDNGNELEISFDMD